MSNPSSATLVLWALRRRCPNCGIGKVYNGFTQNSVCDNCRYRFSREYGYFLGALIVTYALVGGVALVVSLILASAGVRIAIALGLPLLIGLATLPLFIPLSHTLWMAIDIRFDPAKPEDFEPGPDEPTRSR